MDRREYQKAYREANAEKRRAYQKAYMERNREQLRDYYRDYWSTNREKKAAKGRRHYQNKKREINAKRKQRIRSDIHARIGATLRSRLNVAIRNNQKGGSAIRMLGCSVAEFKRYIEWQFDFGMAWENWGEWHLDHIRPMDSFDLTKPEEVAIACHFSNMQPIWSKANLSKGSKAFYFKLPGDEIMNQADIWDGMRIPIMLVSGAVNSGKTLFGLTIDPNCRKPRAEVEPTTILWDQEGSADPYENGLNFEHKDTREAIAAGVHLQKFQASPDDPLWRKMLLENADVNDHPAASLFRAWYLSLLKIPVGKYRVGICDTFTPIQDGLIEWVKRHPTAFGCTFSQFDKASSMFMWPVLKSVLSHILATDCRLRFSTFVMTVHLKNEWSAGSKTGRQIAEGLDVLEKLATVHLELDRSPKAKGKDAPRVPSAILKKERLVRFGPSGAEDLPILPPRLPECTPDAIRAYIANPPDFAKLTPDERLPDQSLSDDQKLLIQQDTARNEAEAAQARLSALEMAREAAIAGAARTVTGTVTATPTTQQQVSQPQQAQPQPEMASQHQTAEMIKLFRELFVTGAEAAQWLSGKCGTNDPQKVTASDADGVLAELNRMVSEKRQADAAANLSATEHTTPPTSMPAAGAGTVSKEQRDRIRDLTVQYYGEQAATVQADWLRSLGYASAQSVSPRQADERIAYLEQQLSKIQVGVADEIPF